MKNTCMEMYTVIDIDTHLRVTYRHDEFHWLSVNPLILLMKINGKHKNKLVEYQSRTYILYYNI